MDAKEKELQEALDDARLAGYLSGIKEVVEWIREHNYEPTEPGYGVLEEDWESKLKEWRLK